MSWFPDESGIRQTLDLLHNSQSTDTNVQRAVHEKLNELNNVPDFNKYLAYILTNAGSERAFGAIEKICEDSSSQLETDRISFPIGLLIPKFLQYSRHDSPKIRSHSLACINHFIHSQSQVLLHFVNEFLECLFALAEDDDPNVRRHVCSAFVQLLEAHLDKLLPHLSDIIESNQCATKALSPYIGRLIPVLVCGMKYSENDMVLLRNDLDEDAHLPDKE
ncbi:Transportin-1, partial [Schistosoma japonicum]